MPFLGLSAAPFARVGDWQTPPLSRGGTQVPCTPPVSAQAHAARALPTQLWTLPCTPLPACPSVSNPSYLPSDPEVPCLCPAPFSALSGWCTMRGALSRGTGTAAGHSPSSCCCSDRALFIDFGKKASAHSGPHSCPLLSAGLWSCQCPYGLEQATCQSSNKDPEQPLQFQCLAGRGLCECEVQPLVNREGLCPKT